MKSLVLLLMLVSYINNAYSASASQAYSPRVGNAIEGIVVEKIRQRGFASNDPRFTNKPATAANDPVYSTKSAIKDILTGAIPCALAGGWIGVGVCLAGSVAVGGASYFAGKWLEDSDIWIDANNNKMTVVGNIPGSSLSSPSNGQCPGKISTSTGLRSTAPFDCDWWAVVQEIGTDGQKLYKGDANYNNDVITVKDVGVDPTYGTGAIIDGHAFKAWFILDKVNICNITYPCTYVYVFQKSVFNGTATVAVPVTVEQAIAPIPEPVLDKSVDPDFMRRLIQKLWKEAALRDPKTVPYDENNPVTNQDVINWRNLNPGLWPGGRDSLSPPITTTNPDPFPNPNGNTGIDPGTGTDPGTGGTGTNLGTGTGTATVDLGSNPNITEPALDTPEDDFFKPIVDAMNGWVEWTVPAHASQCPAWQAAPSISGHVFNIDLSSHCQFGEEYRSIIQTAAFAAWVIIAAFIILSA
jgi:hypothetical protein